RADHAPVRERHGAVHGNGEVHAPIIIPDPKAVFPRGSSSPMRFLRYLLLLIVLACGAFAGAAWWWLNRPLPLAGETAEVSIEPGTPPRAIAEAWVRAGVRTQPLLLYEWFRWSGQSRKIRAGSYEIGRGTTPMSLLNKMVRGD